MYKFKCMILVIVVISFLGCSKSDDGGGGGSSIKLSEIQGNIKEDSKFFTTESSDSNSRIIKRTSEKNSSVTKTLITFDQNGNLDYGLITDHNIKIDQVIPINKKEAIAVFDFEDHSTWEHIISLNCGIIKITSNSNEVSCLIDGVPPVSLEKHFKFDQDIYGNNPFQKNDKYLYFKSEFTDDMKVNTSLSCKASCIYRYEFSNKTLTRMTSNDPSKGVDEFNITENNDLTYRNSKIYYIPNSNISKEFMIDSQSEAIGDMNHGDHKTIFWGESYNISQFMIYYRYEDEKSKFSNIRAPIPEIFTTIKGENGLIYAHTKDGLYSILPFKKEPIIKKPYTVDNTTSADDCYKTLICNIYFKVLDNIVISNYIDFNLSQKPTVLTATRISDNKKIKILFPNNDCSQNCFQIDVGCDSYDCAPYTKWYLDENLFYIPMYDLKNNKYTIIKIDVDNLDFSKEDNQFSFFEKIDSYITDSKIKIISTNKQKLNSGNNSATIHHETSDNYSARIVFNNFMNYESVEENVSIIDNNTNQNITFIPVWNKKTLHMVIDTSISSSSDYTQNELVTGKTYKITLLGSAKDADGNTLGSDIVKYITP